MKWETVQLELSLYSWDREGAAPAAALLRMLEEHYPAAKANAFGDWHDICQGCGAAWNEEKGCRTWQIAAQAIEDFAAVPGCWCWTCDQRRRESNYRIEGDTGFLQLLASRMIVCPDCGNKRCNHAIYHAWKCTKSNSSSQPRPEMVEGELDGQRPGASTTPAGDQGGNRTDP